MLPAATVYLFCLVRPPSIRHLLDRQAGHGFRPWALLSNWRALSALFKTVSIIQLGHIKTLNEGPGDTVKCETFSPYFSRSLSKRRFVLSFRCRRNDCFPISDSFGSGGTQRVNSVEDMIVKILCPIACPETSPPFHSGIGICGRKAA